jgi:LPS-assembly protein
LKKIIAFTALLLFLLLLWLNAFAFEINLTADNLEYTGKQGDSFSAKGNVVIGLKGKKIYADYIEFFLKEKIVNAYGDAKVEESKSVIYADSVTYNYDKRNGSMRKIFGCYSNNVFVRAEYFEGNGSETNTYNMNNIRLSNCDSDNPHVYFKAKRGKIVLNERVTIYNAILYINKIPVFYMPVFSLGGKGFLSKLKKEIMMVFYKEKLSLKLALSYPLTKFLTGKVVLGPLAFGIKTYWDGSLDYKTEKIKGIIHVDRDADKNELETEFSYFQMINDTLTIRSKAIAYFTHYNLSNYKNYKRFHIALIRQKNDSNLNVGFAFPQHDVRLIQLQDSFSKESADSYKKIFLIRPKINFSYYHKRIFFGIMHKFSFAYDSILYNNSYSEGYSSLYSGDPISDVMRLNYTLTKSFNFWERFTLKPTLEILINLENKLRDDVYSVFIFGVGCLNLRFRVTDWMDFDLNYCSRKVENKENIFNTVDYLSWNNYGRNVFSLADYIYIGNTAIVRNSFQYSNLRRLSFVTEIVWNPKSFITMYVKQSQLLNLFKADYFQFYSKIGKLNEFYLNFNIFCKDNKIGNILGFGLWFSPKWRFDYNVMAMVAKNKPFEMRGFEFKIYRNLHCYNFGILFRMTKDFSGFLKPSAFFQFNTKTIDMLFNKEKQKEDYFNEFKGMPESWFY